jgi:type VI secretion system secreted protein VgrG
MSVLSTPRLALKVASGDTLDVRRFSVVERISSLFTISLEALSPNHDIEFDGVVGHESSFTVNWGGGERQWHGLVSQLNHSRTHDQVNGLSTYSITLVPRLWLLTQRRNYRIFQQMSELDIVKKLLKEWEIEPDLQLTSSYKGRKYRVQYGESDFDFVSRLLEDAGISYFFNQDHGKTKLILADAPQSNEPRPEPLPFRESSTDFPGGFAHDLRIAQQVRPGKYTMRDHDYRLAASYPLARSHEQVNVPVEQKLERYHYTPGAFLFANDRGDETPSADDKGKTRTDEKEGDAIAKRRLEAKRSTAKTVRFSTNAFDLSPGQVLRITDHPRAELGINKKWLFVEGSFNGTQDGKWSHHVEVRSADMPFRPALVTEKPKVVGVESATVVGPHGDEIHTDEFGRVRVHFHWDRESKMDDNSSCWIHAVQPWGGSGYGGLNLPRVGQEVIVDFLGGDPDRPVITGRVYTNQQKVPYKLPQHKTRSTWKSDTSPGSGGFNEMMFEDLAGKELVWHQAQKNRRKLVKNDEVSTIGNDRMKLVKNNQIETTLANHTEVTQANRTEITDMNRAVSIGQNMTKLIKADETRKTLGNRQRKVEKNEDVHVGGDRKEHVASSSHMIVDQLRNEAIGAIRSLIVGADNQIKVGGNHALDAGQEIHLKAGDQVVMEAGSRITIKGPGGFIDFHSGGIDIVGNLVRINSGGSAANGKGAHPTPALPAAQAEPPDPPKPEMDDVSKSGIAQ